MFEGCCERLSLAGKWRFAMDPANTGVNFCGGWYALRLPETIELPGDIPGNGLGVHNCVYDWDNAGEPYAYTGVAWYQREFEIPEHWNAKSIRLVLPRTARTSAWLDSNPLGSSDSMQAPQQYELGAAAFPGPHTLTIRVDNTNVRPMQYGRASNGIMGDIRLEARDRVHIIGVRIIPLPQRNRAHVEVFVRNGTGIAARGTLVFRTSERSGRHAARDASIEFLVEGAEKKIWFELWMGEDFLPWDEFEPNLYDMRVSLQAQNGLGCYEDVSFTRFGMRSFTRNGPQLCNNGKAIFLRGDIPVEVKRGRELNNALDTLDYWRERMREYKQYGINHLRFHSHCPPEAALEAADEYGLYMQLELSMGGVVNYPEDPNFEPLLEDALGRHGEEILAAYVNHPSFVMFTLGNEIEGDHRCLARVVQRLRAADPSRLYAQGSNNNLNDPFPLEGDDFVVTNKTRKGCLMARGSCAHADYPVGKMQSEDAPDTFRNYEESLEGYSAPVLSHELGQYETSPNFDDLDAYEEGRKPRNLMILRDIMESKGLLGREKDFFRSSGRQAALCYREDMEMAFRTPGMCGFQLLALNDVLGQGSSLVGMRNALGKPKGILPPEEWRRFCSHRVMLLGMGKYVYACGEEFRGQPTLANFGPADIPDATAYLRFAHGEETVLERRFQPQTVAQGERHSFGWFAAPLPNLPCAARLDVEIGLEGTDIMNTYSIWVYPEPDLAQRDACVVRRLDEDARKRLENGESLLLVPEHIPPRNSVEGHFASNFWSFTMFSNMSMERGVPVSPGTLGICVDASSPIFSGFPTESHGGWQWWRLVMHSRPVILDSLPGSLLPIVSVVDNPMRCHKLGLIFEARVGRGKLLVSAIDFFAIRNSVETRSLFSGILNYVRSDAFAPEVSVGYDELKALLE